ncbi:hypothetical protein SaSA201_0548 [Streptococcus agalactiae]|nr:hypothetical protein A9J19_03160 [Streptococcus agalactiae]EPU02595.1 hypothetical protein SAG0123_01000 [Streptococcus agalactiae STIR-CD-13]EPU03845.1 hypothetical protein SAG0122_04855 [Streptococcus agalactiae STIR-CD-09]EPW81301.1 hypothetical protein SAG0121_00870 [Streptococcus agalactiae STIR-CD-07]AUO80150.1 hypothetical protein SaSA30_0549 [Streptococcus agalactiae]
MKINATYEALKEVVFIDITTEDEITPSAIEYSLSSSFSDETIAILTYNLETILAEKLETIISRGEGSSRPRDRYNLYTLYYMRKEQIDMTVLRQALENTSQKRESLELLKQWSEQVSSVRHSSYQRELWDRYQRQFAYAKEISFEASVEIVELWCQGCNCTKRKFKRRYSL